MLTLTATPALTILKFQLFNYCGKLLSRNFITQMKSIYTCDLNFLGNSPYHISVIISVQYNKVNVAVSFLFPEFDLWHWLPFP